MDPTRGSQALIAAVEQLWPELPGLVGGGWGKFRSAVLAQLCALDDAVLAVAASRNDRSESAALAAADAAQDHLLDLFDAHPDADVRLKQQYNLTLTEGLKRSSSAPPAGSVRYHEFFAIRVFYATDRRQAGPPEWYTGERAASDELSFGVVTVSVPTARKIGTVPESGRWRKRIYPHAFNPQKWSEIMSVERLHDGSAFMAEARSLVAGHGATEPTEAPHPGAVPARDMLILIHGYNVSFCAAARRAAQLAYDLDFTGTLVLYSWPSRGTAKAYIADRDSADWSTEHFVRFVQTVLPGIGARRIHVVAHSMGNRILVDALHRLPADGVEPLGHVVFAAPDFDAQTFMQRVNGFGKKAMSYTLYVSDADRALRAAAFLAGARRAGQATAGVGAGSVLEVVDTSQLPRQDVLGHSGFAEDRTMLNDMKDIIRYGRTANQRSAVQPETDPEGHRYWAFPA